MSTADFIPDRRFMEAAISLVQGGDRAEHPVGAVVVCGDEVVGAATNLTHRYNDPTYHAERVAVAGAQETLGTKRLNECDLYTTMSPCTNLCVGIAALAQVRTVVYGALPEDAKDYMVRHPEAVWLVNDITPEEYLERTPWAKTKLVAGFMRDACVELFDLTPRSAEGTVANGRSVHVASAKAVGPGRTRTRFTIGGPQGDQTYDMEVPMDPASLLGWLPGYVAKAPGCGHCRRLIFPEQGIVVGFEPRAKRERFAHASCADTLAGFIGWLNTKAELIRAYPSRDR